ncbi:MAG TPA: Uma2 family endonuclease [Terriglobia bacterium]|nr:Uma2 family endonuclease [Terriglobia bacterium]
MYNNPMPVDTRLTYEDYCLLPNDGKRYEIIDGELFVSPAPSRAHQKVVSKLLYYLLDFVMKHQLGEVYVAPFDVVFSRFDVVEPDVLYVSNARAGILTSANVQGSPDLVVEVLSDSTEKIDRATKLKLYARFGVREYWIVDPVTCFAEIYRAVDAGLELARSLTAHDQLDSPLFPGFALALQKLTE